MHIPNLQKVLLNLQKVLPNLQKVLPFSDFTPYISRARNINLNIKANGFHSVAAVADKEGHRRATSPFDAYDGPFQAETVGKGRTGFPDNAGFSGISTNDEIRGKTMSKDTSYSLLPDGIRIQYVNAMFSSAVCGIRQLKTRHLALVTMPFATRKPYVYDLETVCLRPVTMPFLNRKQGSYGCRECCFHSLFSLGKEGKKRRRRRTKNRQRRLRKYSKEKEY